MPALPVVVDTNVPVCANGQSSFSDTCALACIREIRAVTKDGRLLLDSGHRIFAEYLRNLSLSGQGGLGDAFMKWVHDNRFVESRCTLVSITPVDGGAEHYVEFPSTAGLAAFDPADRKFVAVVFAHGGNPEILQATDSKWWTLRGELSAAGATVRFVCPSEIAAVATVTGP